MVNSCAVCGCCTRTDIVREHLEDTLKICDVSAKGLLRGFLFVNLHILPTCIEDVIKDIVKIYSIF
jgi:hypothetical protein